MPANPPLWRLATMTIIHTTSAVRDLGLVGALSLAAASAVRRGRDRVVAETTAYAAAASEQPIPSTKPA